MSSPLALDQIRTETLGRIRRNEMWFKVLFVAHGVVEWGGLAALVLLVDWSNRTHVVVFAASLFVCWTLGIWTWALAARERAGEQRIIRAIDILEETVATLRPQTDSTQVA